MEEEFLPTPFGADSVEEIHLGAAPLTRVVAQLRFPQLASMADNTVPLEFAKHFQPRYPLFEERVEVNLMFNTGGSSPPEQLRNPVWRLQSDDNKWVVTLGKGSLSLETTEYAGRTDFCARMAELAEVFVLNAQPPRFDRVGLRYINQITDAAIIEKLPRLIRPEIVGVGTLALPQGIELHHSLTEVQFNQGPRTMLARWGILPPEVTVDLTIPAPSVKSWLLDIDSAISGNVGPDQISNLMPQLADSAYRVFRYTVSRSFLSLFEEEK